MTWEQAPETDPEDTWKGSMGTTCRVVVQKARVGWDWIAQWRIGSHKWHDEYAHWRPTRKCAERSARAYARKFTEAPSKPTRFVVSLNPDDLR